MSIRLIQSIELTCDRCGHTWKVRRDRLPAVCSRCKRADWNSGNHERILVRDIIDSSDNYTERDDLGPPEPTF